MLNRGVLNRSDHCNHVPFYIFRQHFPGSSPLFDSDESVVIISSGESQDSNATIDVVKEFPALFAQEVNDHKQLNQEVFERIWKNSRQDTYGIYLCW